MPSAFSRVTRATDLTSASRQRTLDCGGLKLDIQVSVMGSHPLVEGISIQTLDQEFPPKETASSLTFRTFLGLWKPQKVNGQDTDVQSRSRSYPIFTITYNQPVAGSEQSYYIFLKSRVLRPWGFSSFISNCLLLTYDRRAMVYSSPLDWPTSPPSASVFGFCRIELYIEEILNRIPQSEVTIRFILQSQ